MLGILYLILGFFVGYHFLKGFVPRLFKISKELSLSGKTIKLSNWMVTLPASFLTGTLFVTWITYLLAWVTERLFPGVKKPLFYGDLFTFIILIILIALIAIKRKEDFGLFFRKLRKIDVPAFNKFVLTHKIELIFVAACLILWSVLMIRSFYVDSENNMNLGNSVFSDFGAHIPMIRSFSDGSNFPTEYPHYGASATESVTGNNIRYHFMFQFLSGNLEFLGLRIDWAFNLPSILAIVSFLMLLYSFTLLIFGNRLTGIFAALLFFFRSSFAFFTYSAGLGLDNDAGSGILKYPYMFKQLLVSIFGNRANIGKTAHEDWGFYAQKVFVNKRHYAFALGIAFLVLIIVFPMFKKMISSLKKAKTRALGEIKELGLAADIEKAGEDEGKNTERPSDFSIKMKHRLNEFLLNGDAWLPDSMKRSVAAGLLLGLIGFWNGAVVISALPVLFFMAIFSKNRLEYLNIAAMAVILVFAQVFFFTGGTSTDSISLFIGYLAEFPGGANVTAKAYLTQHFYADFIKLVPGLAYNIFLFYLQLLGFLSLLLVASIPFSKKGGRWLTLAFLSPLVLATLCSFSSDIGANHVIVIFSVILLNIIVANLLTRLFLSKSITAPAIIIGLAEIVFYASAVLFKYEKLFIPVNIFALVVVAVVFAVSLILRRFDPGRALSVSVAVILTVALTASGIVDGFSLYNLDKGSGRVYSMNNPIVEWAKTHTDAQDIFLVNPDFMNEILLSGRKVFNGGAYFVSTAGYDWDERMRIAKQIYGASDADTLRELVEENHIDYIIVDDSNRESKDYKLNEELISNTYKLAYSLNNTKIYRVK